MKDAVGPVLRVCDELELILNAIQEDNPAGSVEVIDLGAYVRIQRARFLRVSRRTLQRHLGSDFQITAFAATMSAFAGHIRTSSDEIVWQLDAANGSLRKDK